MRWLCPTILLALAASAGAQTTPPPGWHMVDQGVGDLDPLSTSLRNVRGGLRYNSPAGLFAPVVLDPAHAPYRPPGLALPLYYRVEPGVRAKVERIDYLIPLGHGAYGLNINHQDGRFIELAGPNTVFDLTPVPVGQIAPTPVQVPTAPTPALDARIDGRIDARIDGRVNARRGSQTR